MTRKSIATTILAGGLLAFAETASAGTVIFDFTSGGSLSGTGLFGNEFTLNSGGLTVTATAYSRDGAGGFLSGEITQAASGLGACNTVETAGCTSPATAIDNIGQGSSAGNRDYILFLFDRVVSLEEMSIIPNPDQIHDHKDTDLIYLAGVVDPSFDMLTTDEADLETVFGGSFVVSTDETRAPRDVIFSPGTLANALLVAPRSEASDPEDSFFIASVTDAVQTPEPATLSLFGLGLLGLGMVRRRRRV